MMPVEERMETDLILTGDWITVAKKMRSERKAAEEYMRQLKAGLIRPLSASESVSVAMMCIAMQDIPLVQYLIPDQLIDMLGKASLDIDLPLSTFVKLPFNPMAIGSQESPGKWELYQIVKDRLRVYHSDCVVELDLTKSMAQLLEEGVVGGTGTNTKNMISIILYLSGGDSSYRITSEPRGGKKERNNPRPTIIRGEVGGKFMSALKRYEAQQGSAGDGTHGSPKPHLRAGHWHLFWTGKGSRVGTGPKVPRIQWVHPCLVNADSVGPDVEILRRLSSEGL